MSELEKQAEEGIHKLADIAFDAKVLHQHPEFGPMTEEEAERQAKEMDGFTRETQEKLQYLIPIMVLNSSRKLERLTRWLIILTLVLSVVTAISILQRL